MQTPADADPDEKQRKCDENENEEIFCEHALGRRRVHALCLHGRLCYFAQVVEFLRG